jgi:hypothetical protein
MPEPEPEPKPCDKQRVQISHDTIAIVGVLGTTFLHYDERGVCDIFFCDDLAHCDLACHRYAAQPQRRRSENPKAFCW